MGLFEIKAGARVVDGLESVVDGEVVEALDGAPSHIWLRGWIPVEKRISSAV